ncbi:hypothetical protein [Tateyamaria sp.]|uniref:hypothetical protein n=1 Tax=Tateyamaria sp. TaxID=1929288 RepID=UPI00329E80FB
MLKFIGHILAVLTLTVLTQLGGIAWLLALAFRRRFIAFVGLYLALSISALWVAPMFGRTPLPCLSGGAFQMQSVMYCALNRQYVVPELQDVVQTFAADMERAHPGTKTQVLDANFPFVTGFPLLPHLSHHDGRKVDLAFYYANDSGYLPSTTRSPIGYFAFEDGPSDCPDATVSLRWDMAGLQGFFPDHVLEPRRMTTALQLLVSDARIGKVFIEPHLKARFNARSDKIRFQGCRAARHDDHIHIQL